LVAAGLTELAAIVGLLTIPAAIGRVTQARRPTPPISHPDEEVTSVADGTSRPVGGLAACALCDPVSRHPVVSVSGGDGDRVARAVGSTTSGRSAHG